MDKCGGFLVKSLVEDCLFFFLNVELDAASNAVRKLHNQRLSNKSSEQILTAYLGNVAFPRNRRFPFPVMDFDL